MVDAVFWQRLWRLKAVAGHEQGIGEKEQQLLEVVHAAMAQIRKGFCHNRGWRRRGRGQFGIGVWFARPGEKRNARPSAMCR
jgi:hypothetical protein